MFWWVVRAHLRLYVGVGFFNVVSSEVYYMAEYKVKSRSSRTGGVTLERAYPKIGRNQACPCGSGKKYKKCHNGWGPDPDLVGV